MVSKKRAAAGMAAILLLAAGTATAIASDRAGESSRGMQTAASAAVLAGPSAAVESGGTNIQEEEQGERQRREETAQRYSAYRDYGLTYDRETDHFYFGGVQVRYFRDTIDAEGHMNGFSNAKGQIDLRAVRDAKFRLTGIEKVPVEESDNRTREWSRNTDIIANKGTSDSSAYEEGDPAWMDDSLNAYTALGVSYSADDKQWMYRHQEIRGLYDEAALTFVNEGEKDGVYLKVVRNAKGGMEGLEAVTPAAFEAMAVQN